jgi:hypothetical protein
MRDKILLVPLVNVITNPQLRHHIEPRVGRPKINEDPEAPGERSSVGGLTAEPPSRTGLPDPAIWPFVLTWIETRWVLSRSLASRSMPGMLPANVTAYPPRRCISAATKSSPARPTCWLVSFAGLARPLSLERWASHRHMLSWPARPRCRLPCLARRARRAHLRSGEPLRTDLHRVSSRACHRAVVLGAV